jgi:hypothetical protein
VIAAPILSVAVIIALVLAVLRRRWRLQHQRVQARIQWPTFVGFSQVREMHQESVLRSREEGPPSLPPLQSTVGWNDPSPGAFAFGEPAQDPFAPTPPMIFRPLPDVSPPRIGHSVSGRYVAFQCLTRSWALLDARPWWARPKGQIDLARQALTTRTSLMLRRV